MSQMQARWGVAILALVVTLVTGLQDIAHLDRLFLPDDTYYTLSIARNLAAGVGPSTDGVIMTSGFQPLIAVLQMPVFWVTDSLQAPVSWTIALSAVFGVLSIWLAMELFARSGVPAPVSFVGGALLATSPMILSNALNGLETSLATALLLWLILRADALTPDSRSSQFITAGVIAGLCLLARIDTCFVIAILGVLSLQRVGVAKTGLVAVAAFVVVGPFWVWSQIYFGMPIPESGAAVRDLVEDHIATGSLSLTSAVQRGFAAIAALFQSPFGSHPLGFVAILALVGMGIVLLRPLAGRRIDGVWILALGAVIAFVFYVTLLPVFWFFDRYFQFVFFAVVIAGIIGLQSIHFSRVVQMGYAVFAAFILAGNLVGLSTLQARFAPDTWNSLWGVKGYAAVAQKIVDDLPDDAVLGAMQSGALGYFVRPGQRVVNLDGVVSGPAHRALKAGAMADFLSRENVTHFADWPFNHRLLLEKSGLTSTTGFLTLVRLYPAQQNDAFSLYEIGRP